jgi:hypothetical protein
MRGEFIDVWSDTWRAIWVRLLEDPAAPRDISCELYRELASHLDPIPSVHTLASIIDNSRSSRTAFKMTKPAQIGSERALLVFLESAHAILDDLGGDALSNRYFKLVSAFIEKYNLRYELRRPCLLCPTLPGLFASLHADLRAMARRDAHLDALMQEFDDAVRDLRTDRSEGRIKSCIHKQFNLVEAIGRTFPGVTRTSLGSICNEVGTWPHDKMKEAIQNLYMFASDYPGIRHAGTPANARRAIEMRDLVSMSILLAGFTPYLSDQLDVEALYSGT